MSRGNREEMINDIDVAIAMLVKTREELDKAESNENGSILVAHCGEYSLNKIKRNCTTVRELLLCVRKGCEWPV